MDDIRMIGLVISVSILTVLTIIEIFKLPNNPLSGETE